MSHRSRCLVVDYDHLQLVGALYRLNDPSALYLCLYNHMERTMLTFGGRGTSTQVLLSMIVLYSSHIACFQLGSRKAWKRDLEMGEEVVTWKLYLGLAFTISTLERVTIGCCEVDGSGGGGGELFGGGMFGGSVVFSGDGVGNGVRGVVYGVACGVFYGVVCGGVC
ncbi:hypothetical protein Tco_0120882 [Tanacetum coccineum]